jgi:hypothetical protein
MRERWGGMDCVEAGAVDSIAKSLPVYRPPEQWT